MFNNNKIKITNYNIYSEKIHDDIVIAHLSDLHEKEFGHKNHRLFRAVAALKPDIIAITGDLVAHERQKAADIAYTENLAAGLSKIAPTYFVTGNHERHFHDEIVDALARNGVATIHGHIHSFMVGQSKINLSGVHDTSYTGLSALHSIHFHNAENADGFNIFLSHRPEFFEWLSEKNVDLVLCGHTHAGQIRFPKFGAFVMEGQGFFPKYVQGEYKNGDTTMIISRGLGSSGYPAIRINNPPDLVAINIRRQPAAA
ncbi:MAG: metallophosphoesterase [Christensenellaceae bacterium]|jgi:predicted MPP superfamily phosphohydrolase